MIESLKNSKRTANRDSKSRRIMRITLEILEAGVHVVEWAIIQRVHVGGRLGVLEVHSELRLRGGSQFCDFVG